MEIKNPGFVRLLKRNLEELLGGLQYHEMRPRMTSEKAAKFLGGKDLAACFEWKGRAGIFFYLPAVSGNQIFFTEFTRDGVVMSWKMAGVGDKDSAFIAHGYLIDERPDCVRRDSRHVKKQGILTDAWVSGDGGQKCYQLPFVTRQRLLEGARRWIEAMSPRGLCVFTNPLSTVGDIGARAAEIRGALAFSEWLVPERVLVFMRDGLGPTTRGGRGGAGRNTAKLVRSGFLFPMPSAEEIATGGNTTAMTTKMPSPDDAAAPPASTADAVFHCMADADLDMPDQFILHRDDDNQHAIVRCETMSRLLGELPAEGGRVRCRWLAMFNGWEPIEVISAGGDSA